MTYQEIYNQAIKNGCSEKMADMLASRRGPGMQEINASFLKGRMNNQDLSEMSAPMQKVMTKRAEAAGVSVHGKIFHHGLARYPGDPKAWVRDFDEVKARVKEKGWEAEGEWNYTPETPPAPLPRFRDRSHLARVAKTKAKEKKRA